MKHIIAIQRPNRFRRGVRRNEPKHRINERIFAQRVRVVGDNIESEIVPIQQAVKMAEDAELDLVEIAPKADPPVCKIIDYKKFLYDQKKKQKEIKQKAQKVLIKEIRFGPHTDDHDFDFKLNHAKKFLSEGAKVKAFVFFKGRSIVFSDQGKMLLLKFATALEDLGKVEQMPKMEGKRMNMVLAPKKQK